jgi:tetratricopeptide (TPR) repeat protein
MAYRKLALEMNNRNLQQPRVHALLQKAYDHRDRLSDAERYLTIGSYFASGPHPDRAKTISAYESLLDVDPDNITALNNVSIEYLTRRDFARAEQLLKHGIEVQPTVGVLYTNLILSQLLLGKSEDAQQTAVLMAKNLPRNPATAGEFEDLARSRGDYDRMLAISDSLRVARPNDAATQRFEFFNTSQARLVRGQLVEATRSRDQLRDLAVAAGNAQAALNKILDRAELDAWFRDDKQAGLRNIERALAAHPLDSIPAAVRPYVRLVFLYSAVGRADLARQVLARADREPAAGDPEDRQAARHAALGLIAVADRQYDEAVREFRAADVGECVPCALPMMARAYDLGGHADSAIAVFARYANGLYRDPLTDGLQLAGSHKRLGELYEAKGDRQNAAAHYAKFIQLWKNADPELQPKVAEVKRRLARLSDTERKP